MRELIDLVDQGESSKAIAILESNPELRFASLSPGTSIRPPHSQIIHAAAANHGAVEILRYLLDHGVDPNTRGNEHQTPLHDAAWTNNVPAITLLLERGADLEATDIDGYTPLDKTYRGSKAAFAELLNRGAKPGLFVAVAQDRLDLIEQLLREQRPEELQKRVPDPRMLFDWAQGCGDYRRVMELVQIAGYE